MNQQQPPTGEIRASNATSTEALVSEALGMFGPGGGDEDCPSPPSSRESPSAKKGKGSDVSAVAGVVKNSLNHLVREMVLRSSVMIQYPHASRTDHDNGEKIVEIIRMSDLSARRSLGCLYGCRKEHDCVTECNNVGFLAHRLILVCVGGPSSCNDALVLQCLSARTKSTLEILGSLWTIFFPQYLV